MRRKVECAKRRGTLKDTMPCHGERQWTFLTENGFLRYYHIWQIMESKWHLYECKCWGTLPSAQSDAAMCHWPSWASRPRSQTCICICIEQRIAASQVRPEGRCAELDWIRHHLTGKSIAWQTPGYRQWLDRLTSRSRERILSNRCAFDSKRSQCRSNDWWVTSFDG
jgi:hypothetical protein